MDHPHNQQILTNLDFSEPFDVNGRSSIADLIKPSKRCGIYVLHFSTGEYYAGLSKNVTARFAAHQRKFDDIIRFSFKQIAENHLKEVETKTIHTLESEGFRLRNIIDTSIPKGESDFDNIMSEEDQERWNVDFDFIDGSGPRLNAPDLRRKYRRKYERLMKKPFASEFVRTLQTYVRLGIPAFRRGELDFWSISCLPKSYVYSRINIYWQEVCTAYIFEDEPWLSFHFAKSPLDKLGYIKELVLSKRYHAKYGDILYRRGGPDQIHMVVPLKHARKFINNPTILASIRLFNMRLMQKGPNNNAHSHCMDLADKLI